MAEGKHRVVVTGLGAVTCLAVGARNTFTRLLNGESGIRLIQGFDCSNQPTQFAGEVLGTTYMPEQHFDKHELRRLDPFSQFGVLAAREAMADAGAAGSYEAERGGAILGTGIGGIHTTLEGHDTLKESGPRRVTPFFVPNLMPNALAGNIAIEFGLAGPCFLTASACASSGHAIGMALREVRSGRADIMVTGGSEAAIMPVTLAGFSKIRALSSRNQDPQGASRPFDRDRDGFVLADGAAVLVLESLEHARARGARVYCEIAGFGQTDDAGHITAPDPTARRPAAAMTLAMRDGDIDPSEVDYVNAHGTSTELNDAMESNAIKLALGLENARRVAISSTKSMLGHLLGGASAVEAMVSVLTLADGVAHGTRNIDHPDLANGCDLDYMADGARSAPYRAVLSNSFGFGGHNVCLAFRRLS